MDLIATAEAMVRASGPGRRWNVFELAAKMPSRALTGNEVIDPYLLNYALEESRTFAQKGRFTWAVRDSVNESERSPV